MESLQVKVHEDTKANADLKNKEGKKGGGWRKEGLACTWKERTRRNSN